MRSIRLPMNPLDFDQLTSLAARSFPSIAPQWTDHNTHDPGIMLLELLSWIAEAQMYGLSRTRKDERLAFARLLGLTPRGPLPASGLVWATPDVSPAPWAAGYVVPQGTAVTPDLPEAAAVFHNRIRRTDDRTTEGCRQRVPRRSDGSTGRRQTRTTARRSCRSVPSPTAGDRLLLEFEGPLVGERVRRRPSSRSASTSPRTNAPRERRGCRAGAPAAHRAACGDAAAPSEENGRCGFRRIRRTDSCEPGCCCCGSRPAQSDATERAVVDAAQRDRRIHASAALPADRSERAPDRTGHARARIIGGSAMACPIRSTSWSTRA